MKKILIIILAIFLFSCEKKECSLCKENQTFTLIFRNQFNYVESLVINNIVYNVRNKEELHFTVAIKDAYSIHVIYKTSFLGEDSKTYYKDTISYMVGRPNACANYNYFW